MMSNMFKYSYTIYTTNVNKTKIHLHLLQNNH